MAEDRSYRFSDAQAQFKQFVCPWFGLAIFILPAVLSTYTRRGATEAVAVVWRVLDAMGDVPKPCSVYLGAQAALAGPVWLLDPDAPAIGVDGHA